MTTLADKRRRGWRLPLASLAILAGLALLIAAGVILWRATHQPLAYRYVLGRAVPEKDLGVLEPYAKAGVTIRSAQVVAASGAALADLSIAQSAKGPVLLDWTPLIDPPFLQSPAPAEDVTTLAPVLERHVADGEPVLAWWDSSRQLELLAKRNFVFDQSLGVPWFLPPSWSDQRERLQAADAEFWQRAANTDAQQRFMGFVQALLSEPASGMAQLRQLAGDRKLALVLHARDMLLLGELAPARVGVAFRDFANTGDVHGMIPEVHAWLREHQYPSYAIMRLDGGKQVRAIALTDAKSGTTLAARLLPFVGNDQSTVPGTVLVYKTGGFWVYEIDPADQPVAASGHGF